MLIIMLGIIDYKYISYLAVTAGTSSIIQSNPVYHHNLMMEKRCPQSLLATRILVKTKLCSDGHVATSLLYAVVATSMHGNLFTSEYNVSICM